jgi:hypothetical protein
MITNSVNTTGGNSDAKKSSKTFWIVIGVLAIVYALSTSSDDRGSEAAADAQFHAWVDGTVDNTWGGK